MKVITIESETFKELLEMFKIATSYNSSPRKESKIYDDAEFMQLMNISKKTAQRWRDKGIIKFSQVGRKIYYKQEDIDEFLEKNKGL